MQPVWSDRSVAYTSPWITTSQPRAGVQITTVSRAQVPTSYRPGCPVGPASLCRVTTSFRGWGARWERGSITVASWAAADVKRVMELAARSSFPFRRPRPVDAYGASDIRPMAADNTSAFNCRKVTGNPYRWSQPSWGDAIDVNPYVTSARVYPAGSQRFLARSPHRKGMVTSSGVVRRAFAARGWQWGARWSNPDYQHFSRNGG